MMKYLSIVLVAALFSFTGHKDAKGVLKDMHTRYAGNWYKSFTFTQTTEHYRNDSLVKTSTWYEAIIFPDRFRIDFDDPKAGNAVLYLGDSMYMFRKGKMTNKRFNDDNLTFLLGGMYFYSLEESAAKLKHMKYDLDKFHETTWKGKPVYVIGASNSEEKTNQLWIDKEKLVIVKFIKFKGTLKEEGIFYEHKPFGKAWSETAVDFYMNDKLVQREKYHDYKADVRINEAIFDPVNFITIE